MKTIDGVTTEIAQPAGLSNKTPSLRVRWDRAKLGVAGDVVARTLFEGEPRIALSAAGGGGPGADRRVDHAVHDGGRRREDRRRQAARGADETAGATPAKPPAPPAADLSGAWDVEIQFAAGAATPRAAAAPARRRDRRRAQGDFLTRDLTGSIDGDAVRLRSFIGEEAATRCRSSLPARWRGRALGHARHGRVPRARRGRQSGAPGAGEADVT